MSIFHSNLIKYINTGCFSKGDYIRSLINTSGLFRKNASRIIGLFKGKLPITDKTEFAEAKISLKKYQGINKYVLKMMNQLEQQLKPDLLGAYVHGSLATNEEITYSDFDTLVIVKDSVFENEERLSSVGKKLYYLQHIMHEFDPLQHHGWFVMTEGMLQDYPRPYFPLELFEYSRSLFSNQGLNFLIKIKERTNKEFQTPFYQLSNGVLDKLINGFSTKNSFNLKSLFSEFMLLPAFYMQAKFKCGVYKKDSFRLAENDFEQEDWEIMNEVSAIRTEWSYQLSPIQKKILCSKNQIIRKVGRKFAPQISKAISVKLTIDFYERMALLAQQMQSKLKEKNND